MVAALPLNLTIVPSAVTGWLLLMTVVLELDSVSESDMVSSALARDRSFSAATFVSVSTCTPYELTGLKEAVRRSGGEEN